jgi:hypothetical protein
MFDRKSRESFDPGAACTVVWRSRKMFSGMIRITGVELKPSALKPVYLLVL